MTILRFPSRLLSACFALGIALASPAAAIQNIGFPDDMKLTLGASDLEQFQTAQKALHNALNSLLKYDGVDGETTERDTALKAIGSNAQIIQAIAKRAGNSDVATFMATLKGWATSGDADDHQPELLKKIGDSLTDLKVNTK